MNTRTPELLTEPQVAHFVRGFFTFLEREGVAAAALHGWQDGFVGELSDVDFVIEPLGFARIAALVHAHCQAEGWQLCQILRHETTAAYCICVSKSDPMQVVALDACSDFQRNGMFFLKAGEMLADTQAMPWGGRRLSEENHLLYRVLKAAGKVKDVDQASREFLTFPETTRSKVAATIEHKWGVRIDSWDTGALRQLLPLLAKRSFSLTSVIGSAALWRCVKRLVQPTGMLVVAHRDDGASTADRLEILFGHLYFRRFRKSERFCPALLKDLVASTLIVVPALGGLWSRIIPADCLHRMAADEDWRVIAVRLHQRCMQREIR